MQMTESFATTTAVVAPVILIAAALEVSAYQQAIQGWVQSGLESLLAIKRSVRDMTDEERREAIDRFTADAFPRYSIGALKTELRFLFGVYWALVMVAQAVVTVISLAWLVDPTHPANSSEAQGLLVSVGVGAATVAIFPLFRLLNSPVAPVADWWWERHLREEQRRGREEAES
ncbi:hypothetical protein [Streptomyces sp. NPDC004721]